MRTIRRVSILRQILLTVMMIGVLWVWIAATLNLMQAQLVTARLGSEREINKVLQELKAEGLIVFPEENSAEERASHRIRFAAFTVGREAAGFRYGVHWTLIPIGLIGLVLIWWPSKHRSRGVSSESPAGSPAPHAPSPR